MYDRTSQDGWPQVHPGALGENWNGEPWDVQEATVDGSKNSCFLYERISSKHSKIF